MSCTTLRRLLVASSNWQSAWCCCATVQAQCHCVGKGLKTFWFFIVVRNVTNHLTSQTNSFCPFFLALVTCLTYLSDLLINKYLYYLIQGIAGPQTVTLMVGNMSQTANGSFTYDINLTPQISGLSPLTTTVIGELRVKLGSLHLEKYKTLLRRIISEECLDYVLWYG